MNTLAVNMATATISLLIATMQLPFIGIEMIIFGIVIFV